MGSTHQRGVSHLLVGYILLCFIGLRYVSLNISYRSPYSEYEHSGYSLAGDRNGTVVKLNLEGDLVDTDTQKLKFIVFVITAPGHVTERQLIRAKSWAGYEWRDGSGQAITNWKYVFVVGQTENPETQGALEDEIREFGDMIVAEEQDSYHNLVLKVMWILKHAAHNYHFDFLIKTDDDTFINIALMDQFLSEVIRKPRHDLFYGGVILHQSKVFRRGRYGVSPDQWPEDVYPPYCSGSGYILGFGAVVRLLEVYDSGVQPVFFVEDAFVGTLAHHTKEIQPQSVRKFYWHQKYGCRDRKAILMHYVKGEQMSTFMERYQKGLAYC